MNSSISNLKFLNEIFDETISNYRCDFSCDENYEIEIIHAIYIHCVEGNPKYIRSFERVHLNTSHFRFEWLHKCRENLRDKNLKPTGWWSKSYFSEEKVCITDEWNAFTQNVFKCFMQYKKFQHICSVKDTIPDWWFVIRASKYNCPAEKYFCDLRNSILQNALEEGNIEPCLPAFPGDDSSLILSRPKMREEWEEEERDKNC